MKAWCAGHDRPPHVAEDVAYRPGALDPLCRWCDANRRAQTPGAEEISTAPNPPKARPTRYLHGSEGPGGDAA